MTDRFPRSFALLKVHEGGYSDHPDDPGGATMKGVTQRTYDAYRQRHGYPARHVRQILDVEVEAIYRNQYWHSVKADELPSGVAYCVFDAAVNSGPGRAVRWLQAEIGAKVDGVVGNETVSKIYDHDPVALINRYCDRRLAFMKRLKHWSTFKNGWTRRVAEVRAQSIEWATGAGVVATETKTAPQPKAEGPEKKMATVVDATTDKGAWTTVAGSLGSLGALASGSGPVQYAIAVALVLVVAAGIYMLVRERSA